MDRRCVRSAYWIGAPRAGEEARFASVMNEQLLPMLRLLPGVQEAWALWPTLFEPGAPQVACQVVVVFAHREALAAMLASPQRQAMRAVVQDLLPVFDGVFSHIEFDLR